MPFAFVASLACVTQVRAQSLQRLTVTAFTLSADTAHPQFEVPFHLIVALHVRERVREIDNLDLPILAELELLGDVRAVKATRSGSDYRETITVVAHHTGTIAIAPATLQAVDARDGKAKEYFTNPLRLHVAGGPLEPLQDAGSAFGTAVRWLVWLALWLVGIGALVLVVVLVARRRPAERIVIAPPVAPAELAPRSRTDVFEDALLVLRADASRASAVRARAAVWASLGANAGETLADVLHRPQARVPATRGVLIALERAAFTHDDDLRAAIDDACAALQRAGEER